jgi:hypothetical protein
METMRLPSPRLMGQSRLRPTHARVPECLVRIVRADLLLRSTTSDQKAEGRLELERARALMRETGTVLFENFIDTTDVDHSNTRQISTKAS